MSLNKVQAGRDLPNDFNVIIEIPMNADPIKYEVDNDRRPGRYLLLGSTEFSILHGIRESLTGRMVALKNTQLKKFQYTPCSLLIITKPVL